MEGEDQPARRHQSDLPVVPAPELRVDGPLEIAQQSDRLRVSEGQELHQQHAADPALRIDPKERVVQARPGEASGGAAVFVCSRVDQETEAELVLEAGMKVDVAR